MKAIIGFGIGMVVAWFINWQLHKPAEVEVPLTSQQVQAQAKAEWKTTNDYNGSNIRLWVDYKHNVVCWIYNAGIGSASTAGLSCLPFTQVAGVPAQ